MKRMKSLKESPGSAPKDMLGRLHGLRVVHGEELYQLGNHEGHEEVRSFDFLCSGVWWGFLQELHGKNKLLNYEEPVSLGGILQSFDLVETSSLPVSCNRTENSTS